MSHGGGGVSEKSQKSVTYYLNGPLKPRTSFLKITHKVSMTRFLNLQKSINKLEKVWKFWKFFDWSATFSVRKATTTLAKVEKKFQNQIIVKKISAFSFFALLFQMFCKNLKFIA